MGLPKPPTTQVEAAQPGGCLQTARLAQRETRQTTWVSSQSGLSRIAASLCTSTSPESKVLGRGFFLVVTIW